MNRNRIGFFALFLLLGSLLSATDPEFPLLQSLASFPFVDSPSSSRQGWDFGLRLSYANVFSRTYGDESIGDFEVASLTLTGRKALTSRLDAELSWRLYAIGGGVLDHAIEEFHRQLGFPTAGRELYPRNRVHYRYRDRFDYREGERGAAAPVLSLAYLLIDRPGWTLTGRVGGGLPWSSKAGFSSSRGFVLAGLAGEFHSGNWRLELSGHGAWFTAPTWLEASELKPRMFLIDSRVTYRRLAVGLAVRTSPFIQGDLASTGYLATIGLRLGKRLEAGLIEDLTPYDTTPDFGLYLKWWPASR